ncbi:hypothetical protein PRK78_006809 [Emydomyces testavorans]|uniref:Protein kinase domain-containing protein n=1 Tax=Emydomyces testavorans TaxID=2070801 RepID=A0AAF0IPE0_9EURO|nr:hypothetical protein PRK78_006809 [Emydomyces testavorans]
MAAKQYPVKPCRYTSDPGWIATRFEGSHCEKLIEYTEGGLCPILVDDMLEGNDLLHLGQHCRLKIVGKLGQGSYSTVWLGKDIYFGRFLALKVLRRDHSTPDNSEMRILKRLGKLQAAFFYTYPPTQDRFLCLGMQPLGANLQQRFSARLGVPRDLLSTTTFVKTLITKVFALHRQGIHHGDISPANVALGVDKNAFSPKALQETFQEDEISYIILVHAPEPETASARPANLPEYIIHHDGPLLTDNTDMSLVDLLDFGKGLLKRTVDRFRVSANEFWMLLVAFDSPSATGVFGTTDYVAPELERGHPGPSTATAKSDLWSLGCVILYGLSNVHLFSQRKPKEAYFVSNDQEQLSIIETYVQYNNRFLKTHGEYRAAVARVIHSLLQVDPKQRDPVRTKRLLDQLEGFQ